MDSQPTDKVEGVGDDFVRGGQDQKPIKQKRNSRQRRIVVSAGTPTVTVTEGNGQYSVSKSLKGCHSSFCKLPIHWRAPLGVAHQGKSNCILSISKRLSRCLCPRREQKR
jgi:hypothetical protein